MSNSCGSEGHFNKKCATPDLKGKDKGKGKDGKGGAQQQRKSNFRDPSFARSLLEEGTCWSLTWRALKLQRRLIHAQGLAGSGAPKFVRSPRQRCAATQSSSGLPQLQSLLAFDAIIPPTWLSQRAKIWMRPQTLLRMERRRALAT